MPKDKANVKIVEKKVQEIPIDTFLSLDSGDLLINGAHTADSYDGANVTSGVDPGHTHTIASLEIFELLSRIDNLEDRIQYLEALILNKEIKQ